MTREMFAKRARVGRSTLYRIEHAVEPRVLPDKIARVLLVLNVSATEARATIDDEDYAAEVIDWMERLSRAGELADWVKVHEPSDASRPADLALLGDDGTRLEVRFGAHGDDIEGHRVALIAWARERGLTVMVPAAD